ncbi:alkaline phosphatase PhoY [Parasphingorhabdus litoris]|uniref:Alkaline phosphatase n=1 Tax=Parasphingorhabdus litoris TaxID=394733 RepID=A0ABN1AZT0_9SPHN|nr:alkaline phosphatase family protein [Parasphingorhabdus litoris]
MRFIKYVTSFIAFIAISSTANAENHSNTKSGKPKLVVAISVDQFSADLFSEYRSSFTSGLKRLSDGAVFPAGYQSHAATETCPGHATIMTGVHAGRAGIIANNWIDLDVKREDKTIYCAEDPRIEGTSFGSIVTASQDSYVASAWHLLVPTLGERLKQVSPKSRNVAVSGKDRAALMMGGNDVDAIYWWKGKGFTTLKGQSVAPAIGSLNATIGETIDKARPPFAIPAHCKARNRKITINDQQSVGEYAFQRPEGASRIFRGSPDFDSATVSAALALVQSMKLGQGEATDILSIGLSATDYIGHAFGTGGLEMCIQMTELDRNLGELFSALDQQNIDYIAMLTSDHGGHDLPERLRAQGVPEAQRIDPKLHSKDIGEQIRQALSLTGDEPLLHADSPFGDYYISLSLDAETKAKVKAEAIRILTRHPQVHAVLDGADLAAMPMPRGPVEEWTMAERARASYHPERSGDFIVLLNKAVTPIARTGLGYVATHGSPWDYDRQVPILFWRQGMTYFEQPLSVKTVDIAPTLAAIIDLEIATDETDGRCLDIDGGEGDSCQ